MLKNITTKSHVFTQADIDLLPLNSRGDAICMLDAREQKWLEEEAEAVEEEREADHPEQIKRLAIWVKRKQFDEYAKGGMTKSKYKTDDGRSFRMGGISYLDAPIFVTDDCDFTLLDTLSAPAEFDITSIPKSRTSVLGNHMENKLDILRKTTAELSETAGKNGKKVSIRRAQQLVKKQCELATVQSDWLTFENVAESMLYMVGSTFTTDKKVEKKKKTLVVTKKSRKFAVVDERQRGLLN